MARQESGQRPDGACQPSFLAKLSGCRLDDRLICAFEMAARLDPQPDPCMENEAHPSTVRSERQGRGREMGGVARPVNVGRVSRQGEPLCGLFPGAELQGSGYVVAECGGGRHPAMVPSGVPDLVGKLPMFPGRIGADARATVLMTPRTGPAGGSATRARPDPPSSARLATHHDLVGLRRASHRPCP